MQNGYRDLVVWQKSMDLVVYTYTLVKEFPQLEQYGLSAQLRRAVVSIPSNIAEGSRRKTPKDKKHFFSIALGSVAEIETQLEVAERLEYYDKGNYGQLFKLLDEVARMLNKMSH